MFELVAMILLAISTVLIASVGVGKMVKLKKIAGDTAGLYVAGKAGKEILEGRGIANTVEKYTEEFEDAKKEPGKYAARKAGKYLLGKKYGFFADYIEGGELPKSYEDILRKITGKSPKAADSDKKRQLVKYKIMNYAAEQGYDPAKMSISFDPSLGNGAAYGHFSLKNTDELNIGVAENEDDLFQAVIGYHEVKESVLKKSGLYGSGYRGEARTNAAVLEDLMKDSKENLPEIVALLYYHYRPSSDVRHSMVVKEAKRISPTMRNMLKDDSMKKLLESYGIMRGDISGFSS